MDNEEKNFFEKTLEKKVKGAENLSDNINLNDSKYSAGVFNWKNTGRYDWKANWESNYSADTSLRSRIHVLCQKSKSQQYQK